MLTIDIGNTRLKWARWRDGGIVQSGVFEHAQGDALVEQLESAFAGFDTTEPVIIANVAGEAVRQSLSDWFRHNWSCEAVFLQTLQGCDEITHAYPEPSRHGVDRWASLIGARTLTHRPVCIISAGTAITVDLMDATGGHLGGRILPGLLMLREALVAGTTGIEDVKGEDVLFARNTADAVSSGTLHMLRDAVAGVIRDAREQLGEDMIIIMTGGTAELLLPEQASNIMHIPELVHIGLHKAAEKL